MLKGNTVLWALLPLCAVFSAMLFAQDATSTRDGVYTAAQAAQGQTLYKQQCASCHGATLQGSGQNPALKGDAFLQNWMGMTAGDLYLKIQATMPATTPGSLKPVQVSQLIAYILTMNGYPAGKTELSSKSADLYKIHFEMPLQSGN